MDKSTRLLTERSLVQIQESPPHLIPQLCNVAPNFNLIGDTMADNLLGPKKEEELPLGPTMEVDTTKVTTQEQMQEEMQISMLAGRVSSAFEEANTARYAIEQQWMKNLAAYRALDDKTIGRNGDKPDFRESEEFKPYIRTTTVKTRAAYAQIMEALLQNSRFPLMFEATPVPEGAPEFATDDPNAADSQEDFGIGFEGDGKNLEAGATQDNMAWKESEELYANVNEGRDKSGGKFTQISPAALAAERMTKIILDQVEESNGHTELRKTVFEACLLGTGIMKGIFTEEKTIHKWDKGVYSPEKRKFPKMSAVSPWDLYIDPNAIRVEEAEWVIERHRMTAKQLRELKSRPFFKVDEVDEVIKSGGNYVNQSFEHVVREEDTIMDRSRLWEVLEYWGFISIEEAMELGLPLDQVTSDQVHVNAWVCNNKVLRVMVNPFLPQRIPYFLFNYEINPYNIYGVGVPETMEDSQKMMNGFARLAVDNLALAGNMVFDVDESVLVAGQDMSIYPGKIFRRQGGQAGNAINGVKFPSTANENMMMFREFRQIADESTGIPSVSHGQTGVTGVGRTSSGLNMILENASLNIKTVIRNIDDHLLNPLGQMLFFWNNQFNYDQLPQGDYSIIATGIRSYTKQEIKVQRLQTLLGLVQNPALAPMVKLPYIIRELVKGMDMDPDAVINDMDEAKLYAQLIGMAGGSANGAAGTPPPGPASPIGAPGTTGATGNTESAGNPEGVNGQEPNPTA